MKLEMPVSLYDPLMEQISDLREVHRDLHNNTIEFDRSALGKLYSLLGQVPKKHRTTHPATTGAKSNRKNVKSRLR